MEGAKWEFFFRTMDAVVRGRPTCPIVWSRVTHRRPSVGPLSVGNPQSRLSTLINGNVPCRYILIFPVDFNMILCHLSMLRNDNVSCRYF